ncbi:uncharacterized protein LOC124161053 [Ischnura elegans]|uniref:uncharacterized protein LOC124161053 n=1 Tax=Ischnura elegans TaxID=197161 RepID=UPI001ED86FB1|nr:uncharacterized protein LOC124161053 [Ischnura elegans]
MSDLSPCVSRQDLVRSLETLTGRKDVVLLDYHVKRASSSVEGFASLVLRVDVSYRLPGEDRVHPHVFIVKTLPQTHHHREMMASSGIFSQEWLFFSRVAPLMIKASAGRVQVPLPICYHGFCTKDDASFFLEDLVAAGYRGVNRSYFTEGLDYAHSSAAMKALGKLHALSVVAEKLLDPDSGGWAESIRNFDEDKVFYVQRPGEPRCPSQDMIEEFLRNFKEMCRETEGLPKKAVTCGALDKVLDGVFPFFCRMRQTPPRNRRVIIHGDCWVNNMMFKYVKGEDGADKPADVKFFDLQMTRCGHPSTDFLYFLYMSTRKAARDKYFSTLAEDYHRSFAETFGALVHGPPPYSLDEFKKDLTGKYKLYGPIIGIIHSPMIMLGDDFLLPNAEDLTDEMMKDIFQSGGTQKIMHRFRNDPKFRSMIVDNMMEFLNSALPNGLESVETSPIILNSDI